MSLTIKISKLHPKTCEDEIINFLKLGDSNIRVRYVDLSGLKPKTAGDSCSPGYGYGGTESSSTPDSNAATDAKSANEGERFCIIMADGSKDSIAKLSRCTLHGTLVTVTILSESDSGTKPGGKKSFQEVMATVKDKTTDLFSKENMEHTRDVLKDAADKTGKGFRIFGAAVKDTTMKMVNNIKANQGKKASKPTE